MIKIKNPFKEIEGYHCFDCAPHNEHGLRMEFYEDGEEIVSIWQPQNHFQGYGNVLHGGVHTTLHDEIASWVVFVKLRTAGVTSRIEVKYKSPTYVTEPKITLRSSLKEMKRNIAVIESRLYNNEGKLSSEAVSYYFTLPPEKAVNELHYPGIDAFYD